MLLLVVSGIPVAAEGHTGFGVVLGIQAPDVAVAVRPIGSGAICYIDDDGGDSYSGGEPVILRTSGGCSGVSSARDVRLADWRGLNAGLRLSANADAGKPLSQPTFSASFWYFDANGNNRMDDGDTVYANIVNPQTGFVDNGDVRISPFGEHGAGTVVRPGDQDLSFSLRLLGQPSEAVAMVDTNGNGIFDGADALYLNSDLGGTELVEFGDLRITVVDDSRPFGSFVRFGDSDGAAFYTMVNRSPCATDVDGSGDYSLGDGLYLDLDANCVGSVARGDIRLISVGQWDAGSRVVAGDADIGTNYLRVEAARVAYLDQDEDLRYGPADHVFIDLVNPSANRLEVGDVQLTPTHGMSGGHVMRSGDQSLGRSVRSLGLFSSAVGFLSVSGGTAPSADEPVYLNLEHQGGEGVAPGDVRLVSIRDLPFGGAATLATEEVLPRFLSRGASFCTSSPDASGYRAGEAVYLSFEGCPSQLRPGAVRLIPHGSSQAGSVVGATSPDVGTALSMPQGQHWAFFDSDGDNEWSVGDYLYADLVNPGASRLDVGDIRITRVGELRSGEPVRAQDSDVGLPLRILGNANSYTVFVDSNGDSIFSAGDIPYVNSDGTGSFVAILDIRLAPLPERQENAPVESPSPTPADVPAATDDPGETPSDTPSDSPSPEQTLTGSPPPTPEETGGQTPRTPGPAILLVLTAIGTVLWFARRT